MTGPLLGFGYDVSFQTITRVEISAISLNPDSKLTDFQLRDHFEY